MITVTYVISLASNVTKTFASKPEADGDIRLTFEQGFVSTPDEGTLYPLRRLTRVNVQITP